MKKTVPKAYKFRLYPQNDLAILLAKTFGCSQQHFLTKFLDNNPLNKATTNINPQYKYLSNIDRINSKKLKLNKTAVGATVNVCGGDVRSETLNKNVVLENQTVSNEAGILCL